VDNWKKLTNSRNKVRKKRFGGTFCFSNCHIIGLDRAWPMITIVYGSILRPSSNNWASYRRLKWQIAALFL
jgi:hypothetical protein